MSNERRNQQPCSLMTAAKAFVALGVVVGFSSLWSIAGNNGVLSAADLEVLLGQSPTIRKMQAEIGAGAVRANEPDRSGGADVQTVSTRCTSTQQHASCQEVCLLGSKGKYSYVEKLKKDCGQLCKFPRKSQGTYAADSFPFDANYLYFNCPALFENEYMDCSHGQESPPGAIPRELRHDYLPTDQIRPTNLYIKQTYHTNKAMEKKQSRVWTRELVDDYLQRLAEGTLKGTYSAQQTSWLYGVMKGIEEIKGGTVLVVGTELPWVECILLAVGAKKVVTLEYGALSSEHPQLETILPGDFRSRYMDGSLPIFDAVVSYSSIEHSGLGRYGDALNPYGDVMQVARSWCVTRNGGALVLGLPSAGHDFLRWNADRIYGPYRWPRITANWRPVKFNVPVSMPEFSKVTNGSYIHAVFYGRKVSPAEANTLVRETVGFSKCPDTLDASYFHSSSSAAEELRHCFN